MFVSNHMLKRLSGGIAVAAFVVAVAVPSALAGSFITDTLGGNGSPKAIPDAFERAVAIHNAQAAKPLSNALDHYLGVHVATRPQVHGGTARTQQPYVNGGMSASVATSNDRGTTRAQQPYVNGGMSASVATSNDRVRVSAPSVGLGSAGNGFNWGDAGIGAGFVAGLALLLLLGGPRLRGHKSRVLAT